MSNNPEVNTMLKNEIIDTIRRYGQEYDVTVYEALGVLSAVAANLNDLLKE